mmetsp:Transcript_36529/g.88817  ORF Transcript_36529/g.88817 Transcript_36529/m.88817 type:complete len:210 (-) Transcript_36529:582-1211(-)
MGALAVSMRVLSSLTTASRSSCILLLFVTSCPTQMTPMVWRPLALLFRSTGFASGTERPLRLRIVFSIVSDPMLSPSITSSWVCLLWQVALHRMCTLPPSAVRIMKSREAVSTPRSPWRSTCLTLLLLPLLTKSSTNCLPTASSLVKPVMAAHLLFHSVTLKSLPTLNMGAFARITKFREGRIISSIFRCLLELMSARRSMPVTSVTTV